MSEKQIPAGHKTIRESLDQLSLLINIEINHDVAAENNVETSKPVVVLQVVIIKDHVSLHRIFQRVMPVLLIEILLHIILLDGLQLIGAIQSALRSLKRRE